MSSKTLSKTLADRAREYARQEVLFGFQSADAQVEHWQQRAADFIANHVDDEPVCECGQFIVDQEALQEARRWLIERDAA